ncbi:MAG TPA: four helix bundle protein [Allocoleopsis sp.]
MENPVYNKACKFAIRIVNIYKYLRAEKQEFALSKKLLKCGTFIGANIAQANGSISPTDFKEKMSIAYKESLDTQYWLCLLKDSEYITQKQFDSMYKDVLEISNMLCKIVKNSA